MCVCVGGGSGEGRWGPCGGRGSLRGSHFTPDAAGRCRETRAQIKTRLSHRCRVVHPERQHGGPAPPALHSGVGCPSRLHSQKQPPPLKITRLGKPGVGDNEFVLPRPEGLRRATRCSEPQFPPPYQGPIHSTRVLRLMWWPGSASAKRLMGQLHVVAMAMTRGLGTRRSLSRVGLGPVRAPVLRAP